MKTIIVALTLIFCSALAFADCAPPSQPGVAICYPTANAAVVWPYTAEAAATGQNNAAITGMVIYVDGTEFSYSYNNQLTTTDWNDRLQGWHHITVKAWDANGNIFSKTTYFYFVAGAVGEFNGTCSHPQTGVHICFPTANSWYAESNLPVVAAGSSDVTSMEVYVNGQDTNQGAQGNSLDITMYGNPAPSPYTITVVGRDNAGHGWSSSVSGVGVYWDAYCTTTCDPGVFIQDPAIGAEQGSPFLINATVTGGNNYGAMTAMRAYLGNTLVATSSGPSMYATVTASPGTYVLTLQAWDATGALYRTQRTVNVH